MDETSPNERSSEVERAEDGTPLTKVLVRFVYAGKADAESCWAKPLGDDLFELRNSPWYAYRLNFGDVLRAVAEDPDELPEVTEVVRRSGNRTLRIYFGDKTVEPAQQQPILEKLTELMAHHERADARLLSLDVEPDADYAAVWEFLSELEASGILTWEDAWSGEQPGFDEPPEP